MDYAGYKSTALRHPKQPLIALPQRLTEVTAPVFGDDRIGELDHDLTRQHEGEPQGQRIIVHGHVKEDDGRPVPDTLVEVWQANAGGRYRHRWDNWPSPIDPNFSGAGRTLTDARRLLPLRHDQARRVPVGQPPERLAARAHPLQPVRARVHAAARDPDVLPGRPAVLPGPDVQLGPRRARGEADDQRLRLRRRPRSRGRSRSAGTSCCAARRRRRPRSRTHDDAVADRRAVPADRAAVAGRPGRRARGHARAGSGSTAASSTATARSIPDAMIETWQADPDGKFGTGLPRHRPRADQRRGRVGDLHASSPGAIGDGQAPHIDVNVFARGMLNRCVTRIYFADEDNAATRCWRPCPRSGARR